MLIGQTGGWIDEWMEWFVVSGLSLIEMSCLVDGSLTSLLSLAFPHFLEMPAPITSVWKKTYPVMLYCRARCPAHRRYKVDWTYNGATIDPTVKKHFTIQSNDRDCESRLKVSKVLYHPGWYTCFFRDQDSGGALSSVPARLNHWGKTFFVWIGVLVS